MGKWESSSYDHNNEHAVRKVRLNDNQEYYLISVGDVIYERESEQARNSSQFYFVISANNLPEYVTHILAMKNGLNLSDNKEISANNKYGFLLQIAKDANSPQSSDGELYIQYMTDCERILYPGISKVKA